MRLVMKYKHNSTIQIWRVNILELHAVSITCHNSVTSPQSQSEKNKVCICVNMFNTGNGNWLPIQSKMWIVHFSQQQRYCTKYKCVIKRWPVFCFKVVLFIVYLQKLCNITGENVLQLKEFFWKYKFFSLHKEAKCYRLEWQVHESN